VFIKVCGIKDLRYIDWAISLGFNAIGIVKHKESPRYVEDDMSLRLIAYARNRIKTVAVGLTFDEIKDLYELVDYIQIYERGPEEKLIYASNNFDETIKCKYFLFDSSKGRGSFNDFPDWIRRYSDKTIIAGGLRIDNVAMIVKNLKPCGIDVSSGVEIDRGIKDYNKMKDFINNALNGADDE
jgi:phosphoribosylanthranilate isomerase